MDLVRNASFDLRLMKEPRGFLRVIQFVLSILAFATVCTSATAKISVHCSAGSGSGEHAIKYSYPFNLDNLEVQPFCPNNYNDGDITPFANENFSSSSQFFCFVGVMSFLLCIAYGLGYTFFGSLFVKSSTGATVDFIFSAVWTLMWFIASTAWADRLNVMGTYLKPAYIIKNELTLPFYCNSTSSSYGNCSPGDAGNHGTLIVSVLFGYVNMVVWAAGLWFLFKETRWHKEADADMTNLGEPTPNPSAASDAPYQAPDNSGTTGY